MASIRTQNERYEVVLVTLGDDGRTEESSLWTHYEDVARQLACGMRKRNPNGRVVLLDHYPTSLTF